MRCPNCSSSETQSCRTAFEQGVSSGTVAAPGEQAGKVSMRTGFANRAAPPADSPFGTLLVLFIVLVAFSIFLATVKNPAVGWLVVPAGALVTGGLLFRAYKRRPLHRQAREAWGRSWICRACGKVFIPKSDA